MELADLKHMSAKSTAKRGGVSVVRSDGHVDNHWFIAGSRTDDGRDFVRVCKNDDGKLLSKWVELDRFLQWNPGIAASDVIASKPAKESARRSVGSFSNRVSKMFSFPLVPTRR